MCCVATEFVRANILLNSVSSDLYNIRRQAPYDGEYSATFHFEFRDQLQNNHMSDVK